MSSDRTLRLAVLIQSAEKRRLFAPPLERHGAVMFYNSPAELAGSASGDIDVVVLACSVTGDSPEAEMCAELRLRHPAIGIIGLFDPDGPNLHGAVALAKQRLGIEFAWRPGEVLDFLIRRAGSSRMKTMPPAAELLLDHLLGSVRGRAAWLFTAFNALSPEARVGVVEGAWHCKLKARTIERQLGRVGLRAVGIHRAALAYHCARWSVTLEQGTGQIARAFGISSTRHLRTIVRQQLRQRYSDLRSAEQLVRIAGKLPSWLRERHTATDGHVRRPGGLRQARVSRNARRFRAPGHLVRSELGDKELVLVSSLDGAVRVLAGVTADVWLLLRRGGSAGMAVTSIVDLYGLARHEAGPLVDAVIAQLEAEGLIEPAEA